MATLQDSRSQLGIGTEDTGYPPSGIPLGPVNDPLAADARPSSQVPGPCIVDSLLPTPTNSPTNLTLTWHINLNTTDPLGWSNSAPSPMPQPNPGLAHYSAGWIDQWSSPYVNPALPAPTSFNVYQVIRDPYGAGVSYQYVKNVTASLPGAQSTTLPLPSSTSPGTYEYTVTGVLAADSTHVGGEGPFPSRSTRGGLNPQYVVPKPTDVVVVTNPGNQINQVGDVISLQITASDATSGTLNYTAAGLPAGLSLNLTSGLITGTLTASTGVPAAVRIYVQNMSTGAIGIQDFTWMVNVAVVPAAPTGLASANITTTAFDLSWTAPSGTVTGYNVYDVTSAHPGTKLTGSPVSASPYHVTNGVTGTTRKYAVTAVNVAGEGAQSADFSVTYS